MSLFDLLKNIKKIGLDFIFARKNSPTSNDTYKNVSGPIKKQVAGRDINNYSNQSNAIPNELSWKDLLNCFESWPTHFIKAMSDPLQKLNIEHNLKGQKKFILQRFDKITSIDNNEAQAIVALRQKTISAMDEFVRSYDETNFINEINAVRDALHLLKNNS